MLHHFMNCIIHDAFRYLVEHIHETWMHGCRKMMATGGGGGGGGKSLCIATSLYIATCDVETISLKKFLLSFSLINSLGIAWKSV